jgi:hypothetical protein
MARVENYRLQFKPAEIAQLAKRYGPEGDNTALAAGRRIRGGEYTRKNLAEIYEWKTGGRGRGRLIHNSDKEIADALNLAVNAKTERAAARPHVRSLAGWLVPHCAGQRGLLAWASLASAQEDEPWDSIAKFSSVWMRQRNGMRSPSQKMADKGR